MRKTSVLAASVAASIVVAGVAACHPGEISDIAEADLVLTLYDTAADFGSIATYAMPDTIIRFDEDGASDEANPAVDALILETIATQFAAVGYTRVFPPFDEASPDVVVLVEAARADNTTLVPVVPPGGWWGWWGYWPGWGGWCCYGPGWGPGYPWLSVPVTTSSGTLAIKMLRPEAVPADDEAIPTIWVGVVNGLLEGSTSSILGRVTDLLSQVFDQSPYL